MGIKKKNMSKITSLLFVLLVGTICSMTTKNKLSPFEENLLPQHSMMKRLNNIFVELRGIDNANTNVKTFNAFIQVIEGLISDLQSDSKKHAEILEEMTNKCTAEDEIREREDKESLDTKAQYDAAIAFMNNFIKLVAEKFPQPESFIEFSENLLRHTSKMGKVEATLPVLVMMSQFVAEKAGSYSTMNGAAGAATLTEKLNVLLSTMVRDL